LAEPTFDRAAFTATLATHVLGRTLIARAEVESTNDVLWDALAQDAPDGLVVVADAQTRGRGREGRRWHAAPGKGLVLSVGLRAGCGPRPGGTVALVAGLALARALERLGLVADLKWPNDLLVQGRKLSGILCESRRLVTVGSETPDEAIVVGVGVNVAETAEDFPGELRETATSLALAGLQASREVVAAGFLNALEPLWAAHEEGGREEVLAAWKRRATFWGRPVTVRTPTGPVSGTARDLDRDGALVIALPGGREAAIMAGDVEIGAP